MPARWLAAALALLPASCRLADVTIAPSEDVLVVEAILQANHSRQVLLLHRSLDGKVVRGETGARVWLTTASGSEIRFNETGLSACAHRLGSASDDSLTVEATCYATPLQVRIAPGATYELRVVTTGGEELRGRTTVPGTFSFRTPLSRTCALPPRTNLPLVWTPSGGAWSYLSSMEIIGLAGALDSVGIRAPERLELTGLSISEKDTTLVIPSQFGIFEVGSYESDLLEYLQGGFPPDVSVRATVSAVDRNYVNSVRGGSFNPSGPVRISSIVGDGIGVFGSVNTLNVDIEVIDLEFTNLPPCGSPPT